ncbi:DUF4407 domain-containing protein [Microbacterium sp. CFBP9034]|uniref:DUF4407 domain-containing protein n=1 Tax=Microbacterium sp. CFBP9034 TaxID=3096540 RepID=UPI002A6A3C96|nr:DUF4407 domain-containing protein [Microbacterium sp. CFBP9034]MDY0910898.1 DUF4407 domain-containing protein [Microbacterium sp. CFBP9034]
MLGGADLRVLERARSEKNGLVSLGLVVLSTATVAAISMFFAVANAMGQPWPVAIVIGLVWGAIIVALDRLLIKSMQGIYGVQALWFGLPRLLMALVIGVVVSIPITLQIFDREIEMQVHVDNVAAAAAASDEVESGPVAQQLKSVEEEIAANEAILRGDVQGLTSPELQTAQLEFDEATTASEAADAAKTETYKVMVCEKEGAGSNAECDGLASQTAGEGPLYEARVREYQDALGKADAAADRLATARVALETARTNAVSSNAEIVEEAQLEAQNLLCGPSAAASTETTSEAAGIDPECVGGLRAEAVNLRQQMARAQDPTTFEENTGMLARLQALHELSAQNPLSGTAHIAIALLFIIIELMPVTVKTLLAFRGESQYDRIALRLQEDELNELETEVDTGQVQREREMRKREEVREDMLQREIALGKTANAHVAEQMQSILAASLDRWSADVQETLERNRATSGTEPQFANASRRPYDLPPEESL